MTKVAWAIRSFDTALLEGASPRDYISKLQQSQTLGGAFTAFNEGLREGLPDIVLGGVRRAISDTFEPLCRDSCNNKVHSEIWSDFTQTGIESLQVCNIRRAHCSNGAHDDEKNYDHTKHEACKARRSIILLVPEKTQCLRDLKALGCDPRKQYVALDRHPSISSFTN